MKDLVKRSGLLALTLIGCAGAAPPVAGDGGAVTDGGTPPAVLPDGATFARLDGGPGSSVTISWTINGQPGSATSCLGNTATRLWAVHAVLTSSTGYYNSQSERPRLDQRCAAGSQTFPAVVGGCYTIRAALSELRPDTPATGALLDYPPAAMVVVGSTPVQHTIAFTVR